MSPRYTGYIPNSSLSPNIQTQTTSYNTIEFAGQEFGQSSTNEKLAFSQKYNQYNYVGYQQSYAQRSPYNLQTPDTSPTHSPEPKATLKPPKSPQESTSKESGGEEGAVLPTPELSPLEQEQYAEEKRQSNIQQTNNNSNLSPTQQNYGRVQNYRQNNTVNYTNTQPITSVPMANGMYVIGANKSSVEQGHVVTGTFYPPVATSQDQQLLGSSQNTLNAITNNATVQYYSNMQFYPKDYYKEESMQIMSEQDKPQESTYMAYNPQIKTDIMMEKQEYDLPYKPINEPQYQHHSYTNFISEERSDVDSDVDAREFDKYLKFPTEQGAIDSNHNYHRNDALTSNLTYNFQSQHPSVIQSSTNVKPEPVVGHYQDVYHEISQNGVPKTDDDFSEILADVRKTCYSN